MRALRTIKEEMSGNVLGYVDVCEIDHDDSVERTREDHPDPAPAAQNSVACPGKEPSSYDVDTLQIGDVRQRAVG
jgi:hypothetical protein